MQAFTVPSVNIILASRVAHKLPWRNRLDLVSDLVETGGSVLLKSFIYIVLEGKTPSSFLGTSLIALHKKGGDWMANGQERQFL